MSSLSVLMTTYNSGKFVKESIKSILNQDYKDFELLIVDDFSEDDTIKKIESIKDDRIKLLKNDKKGRGNALNFGLNASSSRFIALNDSDDISVPFRLSRQMDYLRDKSSKYIVSSNFACFKNDKLLYEIKNPEHSDEIKKSFAMHCRFMNSGAMYSREHILKFGGYGNVFGEDYQLWLKIMNHSEFYNIQDVLMFVRLREDSLSIVNQGNYKKKDEAIFSIQETNIDFETESSKKELNIVTGWREFFYGTPRNARKHWRKTGFSLLNPRIFIAYMLTFFPEVFIVNFKSFMLRYRLNYYLKYFSPESKKLRQLFDETLRNVK